ncbi:hypothetical protein [Ensifer canadensis]|uniref:hypothetical protein n=1 Tax=Ensifer canadensis TaxID=555315 RepID=UPI0035E3D495
MEELTNAAGMIREAMAHTSREKLPHAAGVPPWGLRRCTLLLGYYLKTLGLGTFDYVLGMGEGEDGDQYSHAGRVTSLSISRPTSFQPKHL